MEVKLYSMPEMEGEEKKFNKIIAGIRCPTREKPENPWRNFIAAAEMQLVVIRFYFLILPPS